MNVRAKKMLSLVLAFVMVLGMLPATVFATNEAGRFVDVPAGAWFSDAVQYVADNGLMVGVDDNHFAPGDLTTRGMVVTVLHRMEGEPSAEGTGFTDVEDGVWYTEAILWAQANGIVEGYGDGTFHPNASMTREEMMAVFYRYSQYKGSDVSSTSALTVFADSAKIQAYAEEAMSWAVSVGLIKGFPDGTIRPQDNSNRAQLATVSMRFYQLFGSKNKTAAEIYYENNSEVIEVIDAETSDSVLTETEAKVFLEERGFGVYGITYEYSIDGEYLDTTEVVDGSIVKHPMYQTFYLSSSREVWTIYVIDGAIFAYPASFNLESELNVDLLISETETTTSYDDESNKFFVTIPYETTTIVKTVARIDAQTLDSLTIGELGKL